MQKPRYDHFALTLDNQIYVFGGDQDWDLKDSSIECLDEVRGEWTLTGKLLEIRLLVTVFTKLQLESYGKSENSILTWWDCDSFIKKFTRRKRVQLKSRSFCPLSDTYVHF